MSKHGVGYTRRCPECDGHGKIALPPMYQSTIQLVKSGKNTARSIVEYSEAAYEPVTIQAASMRLAKLHSWGLLTRTQWTHSTGGKEYVYELAWWQRPRQ